jgi:hypothetical protein
VSDTPRTDGRAYTHPRIDGELMYVLADFARELERENAALRSLLREAIREHVDPYDLPEGDAYIARVEAALGEAKP